MKQSKRNLARAVAKAERRAAGKPKLSRYERKNRPPETALGEQLARLADTDTLQRSHTVGFD